MRAVPAWQRYYRGHAGSSSVPGLPEGKTVKNRLHLDIRPAGRAYEEELQCLIDLDARRTDIGPGDVPWVVLADPEGNEFCLLGRWTEIAHRADARRSVHARVALGRLGLGRPLRAALRLIGERRRRVLVGEVALFHLGVTPSGTAITLGAGARVVRG